MFAKFGVKSDSMKKLIGIVFCMMTISLMAQHQGSHHIWEGLLQKYVNEKGEVNYAAWQRNDVEALERYCHSLGANGPQAGWSINEQKAYWVNVYNAFTIKLILTYYPCLLYTSPSPRDRTRSRMPSSA